MKVTRIRKEKSGEKEWVKVKFGQGKSYNREWFPRLEEIAYIVRYLYLAEDKKYPHPNAKGGEFIREYLNKAMDGFPIDDLNEEYKIPKTAFVHIKEGKTTESLKSSNTYFKKLLAKGVFNETEA